MTARRDKAMALARIGLGVGTMLFALEMYVVLRRIAGGSLAMPALSAELTPTGTSAAVHGGLLAAAGLLITLGLGTRVAALVAVVLNVALLAVDQQCYSHHGWLLTNLTLLLAFAGSDRVWAVRRTDTAPPPSPWPHLLMLTQLSACYLFAAISKMNADFLSGEQFEGWLRWRLPDEVNLALAVGTVATELFLAVGFWFARTRVLAVFAGLGLHGSIVVMMSEGTLPFTTFALVCVSLYPLYACWDGLPRTATTHTTLNRSAVRSG